MALRPVAAFVVGLGALAGCQGPVRTTLLVDSASALEATVELTSAMHRDLLAGQLRAVTVTAGAASQPTEDLAQLLGSWVERGDTLLFVPRFRPRGGLTLTLTIDTAALAGRTSGAPLILSAVVAADADTPGAPGVVIYPAGDSVPENLLRFYLEFATPMAPGHALQRVRLLDERGVEDARAFLDVSQELWDPAGRRLTLLLDPGRVKRGIRTNLESGRALVAGRRYRLEVDAGWPDQAGRPLGQGVSKIIVATVTDSIGPDPNRWTVEPPAIGSLDPVVIRLDAPVDHFLVMHLIAVADADGRPVPGDAVVESGDRIWRFTPAHRWLAGRYQLLTSPELEDPAGNRPGLPFDHDAAAAVTERTARIRWFEPVPREVLGRGQPGSTTPSRIGPAPSRQRSARRRPARGRPRPAPGHQHPGCRSITTRQPRSPSGRGGTSPRPFTRSAAR